LNIGAAAVLLAFSAYVVVTFVGCRTYTEAADEDENLAYAVVLEQLAYLGAHASFAWVAVHTCTFD
jgi:hypothetical protein